MEEIIFYKKPKLRNPYLIVAWPGMGEVAFKAVTYLAEKLKAEEFASIAPKDFFYLTGSIVQEGILIRPELPYSKFYHWKNKAGKNDLIIFISNAQPDLSKAEDYCKKITCLARLFKVKTVVSFAALPQPIDHTQPSGVSFVATSADLKNHLKRYNLTPLPYGQISGMNGLFLGIAKKEGFHGFCLLGQVPLYTIQIENPQASYAVLNALSRMLNLEIDYAELIEQVHVMEAEINKLLDYLKIGSQVAGPIGEEEVERIKKSLSQLTKLPLSAKENIEKLFTQAKTDIAKAHDLKNELDKWNIYKEYEDRFLDLFKKTEDTNN